jgi:ankyrin repeat protein
VGGGVQGRTPNGLTALHGAAAKGQRDVLELLVQLGADVNACDLQGRTALHVAAIKGQVSGRGGGYSDEAVANRN